MVKLNLNSEKKNIIDESIRNIIGEGDGDVLEEKEGRDLVRKETAFGYGSNIYHTYLEGFIREIKKTLIEILSEKHLDITEDDIRNRVCEIVN